MSAELMDESDKRPRIDDQGDRVEWDAARGVWDSVDDCGREWSTGTLAEYNANVSLVTDWAKP